jgi:hypothetical protein
LRRVPEVIAVAGGRAKTAAIRAVLAGGFVTSLVTDATVATELLSGVAPVADARESLVLKRNRHGSKQNDQSADTT